MSQVLRISVGLVLAVSAAAAGAEEAQQLPKISVQDTPDAGYSVKATDTATKTATALRDVPQSISVVTSEQIKDQDLLSIGDVVRYLPGITAHQGENNRDQVIIRGNSSSADFFRDGIRDDVQYYRDLYNLDRIEALRGPNAMIFGRGGGGGVINRVIKQATFTPIRQLSLLGGSYNDMRGAVDFNQPLSDSVAVRLNGVYEQADTFRNNVDDLERYGINPTVTFMPDEQTRIMLSYEYFHDTRTADRGIPSVNGRPADIDVDTFFGNPDLSHVRAMVNIGTASIEHDFGNWTIRNRTLYGDYDRGYQNFVPGAVNATQTAVALTAYNNATARENLFNQTDALFSFETGKVRHQFLAGVELGRQLTDNLRNTGFFNDLVTSIQVPFGDPTIDTPTTFRHVITDADNNVRTTVSAVYVQDQIDLTDQWQVIAGLRQDRFELEFHDHNTGAELDRTDNLTSPRVGVVYKPVAPLSIYASYSVSFLPGSGDQFSSLTTITDLLKPEKFTNYEVGAKWDWNPDLALTGAVYRLDRTNTRSVDPADPTRIVQTGEQRTNGFELGLSGNVTAQWKIAAGYAYQDAAVTSTTAAAAAGQQVAQVPHNTWSLWNTYQVLPKLGIGLGIINRSDMFAAIDDTVTLPGYTRADVAAFYSLTDTIRLQANVENVFDKKYYINADGNNNISPGSPTAFHVGLTAGF
jgi:catecholate siderophore receptor